MTGWQFAMAALLVFPILSGTVYVVALLERCERHLRALHVQVLGPVEDGSEGSAAIRRAALGLNDDYPHRQIRQVLWYGFVLVALVAVTRTWGG